MRLVVGITGASGSIYAARSLSFLQSVAVARGIEVDVVFSKTGRLVWRHEIGTDPASYGFPIHAPGDMTAPFASGSARYDAMVVVPCSAGSLARISMGISHDLVGRAADVMLKERRPLVLVLRESPYGLIHIKNMVAVTEAGACVMPASPSFYSGAKTIEQAVDTVVARMFDQVGIENDLVRRWSGMHREEGT